MTKSQVAFEFRIDKQLRICYSEWVMNAVTESTAGILVRVKYIDEQAYLNRGFGWKRTDIFDNSSLREVREFCVNAGWELEVVAPCNTWLQRVSKGRYTRSVGGRWHDKRPAVPPPRL